MGVSVYSSLQETRIYGFHDSHDQPSLSIRLYFGKYLLRWEFHGIIGEASREVGWLKGKLWYPTAPVCCIVSGMVINTPVCI